MTECALNSRKFDDDESHALLDEHLTQRQNEFAVWLGVTPAAISKRLHEMEKIRKVGRWVLHELTQHNLGQGMNTCLCCSPRKKEILFVKNCDV